MGLLLAVVVGCGDDHNRVLTPTPQAQKTDEELTNEMMEGTLDVEEEMKAGAN
ncbi:hypothetical protein RMSM_00827 [Rhodopirellula maiorica SM1]|uniref:Uncharacterized protein n=2 Tax=Novipirellula TaxID=2795426 RepID=M5S7U8_9BACT|nr:hypothetical protein RMSM_00827 [Rhodopirellula maiorica SM1]